MTITFDRTPVMRAAAPAAVHVDGTARPQLIRRETNPLAIGPFLVERSATDPT